MSGNGLPERMPLWMPDPSAIQEAFIGHMMAGHTAPIAVMVYRAGIRAKIEALEEAIYDCDIKYAGSTVIFTGDLTRRIWELQKELA